MVGKLFSLYTHHPANGIVIHRDDFRFACDSYSQSNNLLEALTMVNTRFSHKNIRSDVLESEKPTIDYVFTQALMDPLNRVCNNSVDCYILNSSYCVMNFMFINFYIHPFKGKC